MTVTKRIGLVAHDNRKEDLKQWVDYNWKILIKHNLICTGTTGSVIEAALKKKLSASGGADKKINLKRLKSGPLGGDQQLGALISQQKIDILIFLWDPMQPQPHDVDVKALLRIAMVYNLPMANNRATADFLITSPLFNKDYKPVLKDYSTYIKRKV